MKKLTILFLLSFYTATLWAQKYTEPKQMVTLGLSGGKAADLNLFSLPVTFHHKIPKLKGFHYSAGIRQNLAFGERYFVINHQETLIDDISNYSVNLFAGIEYSYQRAFIGFNVDLIGFNIGTRSYKTVGTDPVYTITPEKLNLIGMSGCNNNEFYLGYRFSNSFTAKMGFSYYGMSLLYSNSKIHETSSFVSTLLPMLSIEYTLWQEQ